MTVICECGKSLKRITKKHLQSKYHLSKVQEKKDDQDLLSILTTYSKCLDNTKDKLRTLFNVEAKSLSNILMKGLSEYFKNIDENEIRSLYQPLKQVIDNLDITSSTRSVYYSNIRKLLPTEELKEEALSQLSIDREEHNQLRDKQISKLKQKHSKVKTVSVQKIVHVMNNLKKSDNLYDRALLVQLNTGIRNSEILTATFEVDEKDDTKVYISGLSKNKSKNSVSFVSNYPLNLTPKEVVDIVDNIKLDESVKSFNANCNKRIRELFGNGFNTHDTRRIYASISYMNFGQKQGMSINAWINHVLGHSSKGLDTSLFYSDMRITDDPGWKPSDDKPPEGSVFISNRKGEKIPVPKNIKKRDGKTGLRLIEVVQYMDNNDIKITNHVLRNLLGYGADVINKYVNLHEFK